MNCTVLRQKISTLKVVKAILNHDRIIMLGHGLPYGLLGWDGVAINPSHSSILANNPNNVYIWCHANKFVETNKLKGFASGMIISEVVEAFHCLKVGIKFTKEDVDESNIIFAKMLKNIIDLPPSAMLNEAKEQYKPNGNPIIEYNSQNLFYYN
jgi:hypothetical protein